MKEIKPARYITALCINEYDHVAQTLLGQIFKLQAQYLKFWWVVSGICEASVTVQVKGN